jgi:transcriptional regulator with XRE-family HTH domain
MEYFMEKFERLKFYRESLKMSQKGFFDRYAVNQSNASKYESGTISLPDELEAELAADGLNLHWLATGKGEMLIQDDIFRIPLLTKDQAMQFDPSKEIPCQKANSGEYPDISLVPIPRRVMEYSTDLRAIRIFDSRMIPVMRSGDVAILEATGWNGDGIYLYRMGEGLHVSYVSREDGVAGYILTDERKPKDGRDMKVLCDAKDFHPIGPVRAVVKDLFGIDKPSKKTGKVE